MNNKKTSNSLIKNESTRLRFSIWVIIANYIVGIIGIIAGSDLTALGVFLSLCNTPLYVYVLGASFRPAKIPNEYYNQQHSGSGGININLKENSGEDDYNIPMNENTNEKDNIKSKKKDKNEIG